MREGVTKIIILFQIKGDLKDVSISPTGKFIIVSTGKTQVYVYSLKGTKHMRSLLTLVTSGYFVTNF